MGCSRRMRAQVLALVPALALALVAAPAAAWGLGGASGDATPGGPPRHSKPHIRPELINFPYNGRGDGYHSFHHPFFPNVDDPVVGWKQLGSALVTSADGRDIVRLTNARQGLQGVFYAVTHTETNNFNGYFDIMLGTVTGSHEPADGMGLFFTESVPEKGSAMGITDKFRGLGIVIDTFSNSRTRQVPYLYAYVSNGDKPWNADTDGSDTELTKGCQLEMNIPIRIFVQLLDSNLHVAVSMNKNHDRWHTCFKYNNVPMPFSSGGFLAFAGETGHFFANHDVHSAAFIIGDVYSDEDDIRRHQEEAARSQAEKDAARAHEDRERSYRDDQTPHGHEERHVNLHSSGGEAASSVVAQHHVDDHHPGGPISSKQLLATHLDSKVHGIYADITNYVANSIPGVDQSISDSLRNSLQEISSMTEHMLTEVDRQTAETVDATRALSSLKQTSIDLHSYAERFTAQIAALNGAVQEMRMGTNRLRADQEETHAIVRGHADSLRRMTRKLRKAKPHGFLSLVIFVVCQSLIVAGFAVVLKMGSVTRGKMGRMV